jgi:hypothetical protein
MKGEVQILSVDASQGREWHHVVLSLVSTNAKRAGFLKNSRRQCVSLSRAMRTMTLIGHPSLLATLPPMRAFAAAAGQELQALANANGEGRSESGGPSKPHWKRAARTDDRTTSSSAQELLWSTCARPDWRRRSYTPRGDVDVMCTKRPVTAQSRLAEPEDGRSKQRQRYLAPSGVDFFHQHSIIRQPQHDQAQPPHQSQSVSGIDRRYKRGEGLSRRRFTTGWDVNDSMPQRQASGADAHANTRREVQSGATASTDTLDLRWKLNANKRPHWHSRNRP